MSEEVVVKRKGGAPKGNKRGSRGLMWTSAMKKVIFEQGKDKAGVSLGLYKLASKLYQMGLDGDIGAQKEFLDRFVGKVTQKVESTQTRYVVQIGGVDMPIDEVREEVRH